MRWLLLIGLFFLSHPAFTANPASLVGLRVQPGHDTTRLTFILSKKTDGRIKFLNNPNRVLIQFNNTRKFFTIQQTQLTGSNIQSITLDATDTQLTVTLFVKHKVRWNTQFSSDPVTKAVLFQVTIISVKTPSSRSKPITTHQALLTSLTVATKKMPSKPIPNQNTHRAFIVILDPGHGGKDSGAVGLNGAPEKKIVLAIASQLAKKINQTPGIRAILTRTGDDFVPLRQRLLIARRYDADLFISIHADAYFNNRAKGASVYALSRRGATSEAARWLAKQDNYAELGSVELNELQDRSLMVRSVLIDLAQTATIRDSIHLGNEVLDALDQISPLHHKKVEQAPFVVLKSPDIPSILIETGFISNPDEAKRLATPTYQALLTKALWQGINRYVKRYIAFHHSKDPLSTQAFPFIVRHHLLANDSTTDDELTYTKIDPAFS